MDAGGHEIGREQRAAFEPFQRPARLRATSLANFAKPPLSET
jgi:hypothetical protein